MDGGDTEKAEQMRSLFEETNPDFKYFTDIKEDIEELKKQVEKNTADIEVLNQSGGRVVNAKTPREIVMNILNPLTTYNDASQMITQLLTFDIDSAREGNFNRFQFIKLPSVLPHDDLKIHLNDIAFLETCLVNKNVNPKTTSYYVFQHLRNYVIRFKKDKSKYALHIEKLRTLANHLQEFNLEHKIFYIYDYHYFEMSTFLGSNSKPQILNPLDSEKFARDLTDFDFTIGWVMSFLN